MLCKRPGPKNNLRSRLPLRPGSQRWPRELVSEPLMAACHASGQDRRLNLRSRPALRPRSQRYACLQGEPPSLAARGAGMLTPRSAARRRSPKRGALGAAPNAERRGASHELCLAKADFGAACIGDRGDESTTAANTSYPYLADSMYIGYSPPNINWRLIADIQHNIFSLLRFTCALRSLGNY